MKREAFSEAVGMSKTSAGEIEKGRSFPKPENLEKIAKVLNVPLKELFDYSDKRFFPAPRMKTVDVRRVASKPRPPSKS
jgi:transcriptional regulator with XRE-family HTH domain